MAMDDLLKEAIADAKAVRETALANAKAALEEAFTPKLQSMLNATLQNEADMEDEEEVEGPENEMDFEPEVEGPEPEGSDDEFTFTAKAKMINPPGSVEDEEEEEDMLGEEFSLESIIRELEEEAAASETSEDFQLEEESDEELEDSSDVENEDSMEEDIDLEELINELKREYSDNSDSVRYKEELQEVKKSLNEHREVIKYLRSKLNEVNLLNAKLLFTNKLFKKHNLNESQKMTVIENLDRSTTLKECKLIYSTLEEAYSGIKTDVKKAPVRKIVESMASRPIESTRPTRVTVKKIINEGNDLAARFQQLAGIKK